MQADNEHAIPERTAPRLRWAMLAAHGDRPMMRPGQHWHLFCLATTWWTLFFIAGLGSDYFQTAPLWAILLFGELMPAAALGYFGWRRCSHAPQQAWRSAFWIAFYMTVPLFFYDYLYLAVHQARGLSFLQTHWYLTAFYAIPWMLLPVIAWPVAANAANAVTKDKTDKK